MFKLKDRGVFFIDPGERVYPGMIVGEHSKDNDLEINVCRAKKLTNIRTTTADEKLLLPPPRRYTRRRGDRVHRRRRARRGDSRRHPHAEDVAELRRSQPRLRAKVETA